MTNSTNSNPPFPTYRARLGVDQLIVDHSYQRDLQPQRVSKIVGEFDPKLFGTLMVSLREDGVCAVIDGQYRLAAARELGYEDVPCLVLENLTPQVEARLYVKWNTDRKKTTPLEELRARLAANDQVAIDIVDIAQGAGYKFTAGSGPSTIQAVKACEEVYLLFPQGMALKWVLRVTKQWIPDESPQASLITALGFFYQRRDGRVDIKRFLKRVGKNPPMVYLNRARMAQGNYSQGNGRGIGHWMCLVIDKAYGVTKSEQNRLSTTTDSTITIEDVSG